MIRMLVLAAALAAAACSMVRVDCAKGQECSTTVTTAVQAMTTATVPVSALPGAP